MKKITVIALGCLLTLNLAFAGDPTPEDQKWLTAVEKKVADGQTEISTPSQDRVALLKDWAGKKGYTVEVTASGTNYSLKISKDLAKK